jgi:hypothetical protein
MSRTTYARRKKPKRKKSDDILERKGEKIKKKNNWIDVLTFKFFTPPPPYTTRPEGRATRLGRAKRSVLGYNAKQHHGRHGHLLRERKKSKG